MQFCPWQLANLWLAAQVSVIRDGKPTQVSVYDVVVGDIVSLSQVRVASNRIQFGPCLIAILLCFGCLTYHKPRFILVRYIEEGSIWSFLVAILLCFGCLKNPKQDRDRVCMHGPSCIE
jgi:hypothetical protein